MVMHNAHLQSCVLIHLSISNLASSRPITSSLLQRSSIEREEQRFRTVSVGFFSDLKYNI